MEMLTTPQNHQSMMKKLNYYQNEISYYQNRLNEITASEMDSEILHLASRFQEDFTRKLEEINTYRSSSSEAPNEVQAERVALNAPQEGLERFVKSYKGLKTCFDLFLQDVSSIQS
ncbi:MAG: hypothetical protein NW226_11530 [Microscillaceae bacterium]|nr:hypothetical protein [Microscillaceae bacterium]